MHGPPRADGPLNLAMASTHIAPVLRSRKLRLHLSAQKRQLHGAKFKHDSRWGNVVPAKIDCLHVDSVGLRESRYQAPEGTGPPRGGEDLSEEPSPVAPYYLRTLPLH